MKKSKNFKIAVVNIETREVISRHRKLIGAMDALGEAGFGLRGVEVD